MKTLLIAGMDEVGRGSWAGPVVAAAVILPERLRLPGLKDSKLLTRKQRERLFDKITQHCPFGLGVASAQEVDQFGLIRATESAFQRAIDALPVAPDFLEVDGRDQFRFKIPHRSIVRGDQKVRAISAASVIAKVTRDRMMAEAAKEFPHYAFELHVGYGTQRHQKALQEHGPCSLHRLSYRPVRAFMMLDTANMPSMDSPQSPQKSLSFE